MTMKPFLFALLLLSTATMPSIQAQTYQWKDSNGRTVISDLPPPRAAQDSKRIQATPPATAETKDTPKSMAERDLDFRKRQQESKEKAEKENRENTAKAEQKENCLRARQQITMIESGQRMSTTEANGERRFLDENEKGRDLERARKFMNENCK